MRINGLPSLLHSTERCVVVGVYGRGYCGFVSTTAVRESLWGISSRTYARSPFLCSKAAKINTAALLGMNLTLNGLASELQLPLLSPLCAAFAYGVLVVEHLYVRWLGDQARK
ncbi:unnamed protein product [Ectocarpus sp. 6 AP-2014]